MQEGYILFRIQLECISQLLKRTGRHNCIVTSRWYTKRRRVVLQHMTCCHMAVLVNQPDRRQKGCELISSLDGLRQSLVSVENSLSFCPSFSLVCAFSLLSSSLNMRTRSQNTSAQNRTAGRGQQNNCSRGFVRSNPGHAQSPRGSKPSLAGRGHATTQDEDEMPFAHPVCQLVCPQMYLSALLMAFSSPVHCIVESMLRQLQVILVKAPGEGIP